MEEKESIDKMRRLLLSAFACDPTKGSEPGNGWNWAIGLANKGFEVHCITREVSRKGIESKQKPVNLHFHYLQLPIGLEKLYSASQPTMYLYYIIWQWYAYKMALRLHKQIKFEIAHHVTWGSLQMGSFMYKLNVPFIFGPAGGGQVAPAAFKKYFREHWNAEEKRETVTRFMLKYNPACKKMLQKASVVLVSNRDTLEMAEENGARNVRFTLDAALPTSFFPEQQTIKRTENEQLKLLWVGRFMPRKGILLLLDVMKELESYAGITLTVIGDGEMKEVFLDKLKEYKLESKVFWKGKVPFEGVRQYYADHDVFFYTSLRDSCPAQLIEAMAFGMPVVTLNLHGQALIVDDSRGFRVLCETPEAAIRNLKEAILTLYTYPALLRSMSIAAYNFAGQQKWEKKINNIVEQYYPIK
ncbi:glycosyltransferase [Terrimonas sp.]|nr:glycosyltransferase [Terrimonas sp.]